MNWVFVSLTVRGILIVRLRLHPPLQLSSTLKRKFLLNGHCDLVRLLLLSKTCCVDFTLGSPDRTVQLNAHTVHVVPARQHLEWRAKPSQFNITSEDPLYIKSGISNAQWYP